MCIGRSKSTKLFKKNELNIELKKKSKIIENLHNITHRKFEELPANLDALPNKDNVNHRVFQYSQGDMKLPYPR